MFKGWEPLCAKGGISSPGRDAWGSALPADVFCALAPIPLAARRRGNTRVPRRAALLVRLLLLVLELLLLVVLLAPALEVARRAALADVVLVLRVRLERDLVAADAALDVEAVLADAEVRVADDVLLAAVELLACRGGVVFPRDDGARVPPRAAPSRTRRCSRGTGRSLGAAESDPPLSREKSKSRRRAPARASVHVLAALDALQGEGDHHAHLDLLVGVPLAPRHQQRVEVRREVAVEHLALAHGSCVLCGSCGAARRGATKCGGGLTSFGRVVEVARAFGWAMRRWCGAPRRRRRRSCSVKPTRLSLVNFGWGSSGRDRRRRAPRRYGAPAVELLYSRGITIP